MAERHRSKNASRDSDAFPEAERPTQQSGRAGGSLARAIGSEDEEKRSKERPAGVTRVRKADEDRPGTSNLGKENR